ncbi:unnamed protein product [Lampetra planeri]
MGALAELHRLHTRQTATAAVGGGWKRNGASEAKTTEREKRRKRQSIDTVAGCRVTQRTNSEDGGHGTLPTRGHVHVLVHATQGARACPAFFVSLPVEQSVWELWQGGYRTVAEDPVPAPSLEVDSALSEYPGVM